MKRALALLLLLALPASAGTVTRQIRFSLHGANLDCGADSSTIFVPDGLEVWAEDPQCCEVPEGQIATIPLHEVLDNGMTQEQLNAPRYALITFPLDHPCYVRVRLVKVGGQVGCWSVLNGGNLVRP